MATAIEEKKSEDFTRDSGRHLSEGNRPVLYRLSVDQYDRMAREGILNGEDRVELVEGLLVEKMTKNERHVGTTWAVQHGLTALLPAGYFVSKEDPVRLGRSEPEPDVAVLRGRYQDYLGRKPEARDVVLLVEVADTSYAVDRAKLRLYAESGIPRCWIANLAADRIEVYSDPTGPDAQPDYRKRQDFGRGSEVPIVLEGRELARLPVDDLLPPQ